MHWTTEPCNDSASTFWASWDQLNRSHYSSHPLVDSKMAKALIANFGSPRLLLATLKDDQRVVAQLVAQPLSKFKWAVFSPSQAPMSLVVHDRSQIAPEVLAQLCADVPGLALLFDVPADDPSYSIFTGIDSPLVTFESLGTTISIENTDGGFAAYWDGRGRDLKQNVRRYFKRAEEAGSLRHVVVQEPEKITAAVDRFGILESAGWKGREGTALHPDNEQGRFYCDLLRRFAEVGAAQAHELYLGDQLVASRLLISGPTMHVMLKTTYDEEHKKLAVGRLLMHGAIERLLGASKPGHTIEFYTRANEDMLIWATGTRELRSVTLYRNNGVRRLADLKKRWASRNSTPDSMPDSALEKK